MADSMNQGALRQVASPAEAMIPEASAGSPMLSGMLKDMLDTSQQKRNYLQQQQQAYNSEMADYANMVKQSRQPENQEAGVWGAAATAASRFQPTWGNIGPGIAAAGGAAGNARQAMQQQDLENQHKLTQIRQAEVRALETKDQTASLMRALQPGKSNWIQFKDDAGNLHLMDKSQGPGTEVVVPATQNATWVRLLAQGNEIAVKQDEPDKEQFALDYATRMMRTMKPGVAATSTQQPTTTPIGQPAAATRLATNDSNEQPPQGLGTGSSGEGTVGLAQSLVQMLTPADRALAARLVARINANPRAANNDLKTLESLVIKYDERNSTPPPSQSIGAASSSIAAAAGRKAEAEAQIKLDFARREKLQEAQGSGEGKQIAEAPEKRTALESFLGEAAQTKDVASSLLKHPGLQKATGIEGYIPGRGRVMPLAETDSAEFIAGLKTLESRITSLALQNARVGSASGATGFGALDKGEREMLRDSIASLDLSQGAPQVRANLARIIKVVEGAERRAKEGYQRTYGAEQGAEPTVDPDAEYQAWKAKRGAK